MMEKILIVGFGSIGNRHFRNLLKLGYNDILFLRTMEGTLPDVKIKEYPVFHDINEALQHRPDIVFITNPTSKHLDIAIPAAEAGCHLFIEKPLSNEFPNCIKLSELVTKNGLITMIGCQFRFHPLLINLKKGIENEKLGNTISTRAEYGEYLPDWHPWENYRKSYMARGDLGGGATLTLIHPVDYLYWLFGEVDNVHSSCVKISRLGTDVDDDLTEIIFEFQSGIIGQIHLDYIQKPPVHQLSVLGDAGRANLDFIQGRLEWIDHNGHCEVKKVPANFERNTLFIAEMKHFMNAVKNNNPTDIPLSEGIDVLGLAIKVKNSARSIKH